MTQAQAVAEKTVQRTHLTVCVAENENPLSYKIHYKYKDLVEDNLNNNKNKGDKDLINTNDFSIDCTSNGEYFKLNNVYMMAIPWCQNEWMREQNVQDRAEFNKLPKPLFSRKYALIYPDINMIGAYHESSELAESNGIKRVGVSGYGLGKTLHLFGLSDENFQFNAQDITAEKLKQNMGLDVLLVPEDSVTAEMKENLPPMILTYKSQYGTDDRLNACAESIVETVNNYFLKAPANA